MRSGANGNGELVRSLGASSRENARSTSSRCRTRSNITDRQSVSGRPECLYFLQYGRGGKRKSGGRV